MSFGNTHNTVLVVLAATVAVALGRSTYHIGRTCPQVAPFQDLNVDGIKGSWYVLQKFRTRSSCLKWEITETEMDDVLRVRETKRLPFLSSLGLGSLGNVAVSAKLEIPDPNVPAKMEIRWRSSLTGKADFTIIDTDYDQFMAVFECDSVLGLFNRRSVAILSRDRNIDENFVANVKTALDAAGVKHTALNEIKHDMCEARGNWNIEENLLNLEQSKEDEPRFVHDEDIVGKGLFYESNSTEASPDPRK